MRSRPASLTLVVDGERLSIQGDDDRLRAMYSMLRNGDTVAVWTSKSTIGPPKIWQVERRGRPVVRYEERRQRDLDLNTRMVPFAWFMVVLGVVGFSAAAAWPAIMRRRWTPS